MRLAKIGLRRARAAAEVFTGPGAATLPGLTLLPMQSARSQTFITVHGFDDTDGTLPIEAMVHELNGALIEITLEGGVDDAGTVFKPKMG
jgi:hypothetical protein